MWCCGGGWGSLGWGFDTTSGPKGGMDFGVSGDVFWVVKLYVELFDQGMG